MLTCVFAGLTGQFVGFYHAAAELKFPVVAAL